MNRWIGVDLDGTLAELPPDPFTIGKPISVMVDRVKRWLKDGTEVRIVTARACTNRFDFGDTVEQVTKNIQDWTEEHIGVRLPVTAEKDFAMVELWDDRAVQVITNTGMRVDGVVE